ncbi:MAG TPA: type II toxin-antitoxin system RelE/ParE family toxin [Methanosarcinales archaeon]|nr:type II toxin-antitoxin system RelE/ParE family toxin [Methanosarcinales archaeon]
MAKRNKTLYTAVEKKMLQITENPYLGKLLKKVLKGKRRVHIGHFVLIYEIDEKELMKYINNEEESGTCNKVI